jgi:hypothetical protein
MDDSTSARRAANLTPKPDESNTLKLPERSTEGERYNRQGSDGGSNIKGKPENNSLKNIAPEPLSQMQLNAERSQDSRALNARQKMLKLITQTTPNL